MYDYDLFVIGAGSGGVRASRMAASYGARVAICEEYRIGGTCVIRGCIPKKLMVYASHFADDFEDARHYGWQVPDGTFNWAALIAAKDKEISRLNGLYIRTLTNAGVEQIDGRGVLKDAHTVVINGRDITAGTILIATGAWPVMPEIPGIEHAISSNEAFDLEALPPRVGIVGGGFVAVEFAGIFNGLGAEVVQFYRGEQILRGFDRECRDFLAGEMRKKGIDVRTGVNVTAIEKTAHGLNLSLTSGDDIEVDCIMFATGRWPNTKGLGLEDVGVEVAENGAVKVDTYSRSTVENIYAVGDVTDRVALTPVAIKEGAAFAASVFNNAPTEVDYRAIPSAVFGQPPLATVGLTEEQACEEFGMVDVYRSEFRPLRYTLTENPERAFLSLVVDPKSDKILGAHMVGLDAAEIIQGLAIALKCGATKAQFDATVAIHPTTAEEFVLMREKTTVRVAKAAE